MIGLLLSVFLVSGIWFQLLPRLAQQPQIEARLKWLDERNIDPSAMYYTDLESMEPILDRMNKKVRQQ